MKTKPRLIEDRQKFLRLAGLLNAASDMDWAQVVVNGGPPCFHLCQDGYFCGRAERWDGHGDALTHKFVSLRALIFDAASNF